jgi:Ca2+/Na+ antiporter
MLISGIGIIGYIFTPIYFLYKLKEHKDRFLKFLDFIAIFTLINLSTGIILRTLHIDLGYYISIIGLFSLIVFFIPILIYIILNYKVNKFKRIVILLFSVIYVVLSFYVTKIFDSRPSKIYNTRFIGNPLNTNEGAKYQNIQIAYVQLLKYHPQKEKLLKLKNNTDSICQYIQDLKVLIIKETENNKNLNQLMFDKGYASKLKTQLDRYLIFINSEFPDKIGKVELDKRLSTKLKDSTNSNSWEDEYFNHCPKEGVITILSSFQSDIRFVERMIIENYK